LPQRYLGAAQIAIERMAFSRPLPGDSRVIIVSIFLEAVEKGVEVAGI